jgi:hypothetical protein
MLRVSDSGCRSGTHANLRERLKYLQHSTQEELQEVVAVVEASRHQPSATVRVYRNFVDPFDEFVSAETIEEGRLQPRNP